MDKMRETAKTPLKVVSNEAFETEVGLRKNFKSFSAPGDCFSRMKDFL